MSRFDLSSQKRRLFETLLQKEGINDSANQRISRIKDRASFPLSFGQQRLWFLDQMVPDNPFYNTSIVLPLKILIDKGVLEKSINKIIQRHEILRTTFKVQNGGPVQIVSSVLTLPLTVADLHKLPESEKGPRASSIMEEEARRPFDLNNGPLLRAALITLSEQSHIFLLAMHHIICDGWSMELFFHELSTLYDALISGRPYSLPELPVQYGDFALWQRDYLKGEILDSQLSYWKKQLLDIPLIQLPTDRTRPAVVTYKGAQQDVLLPKDLSDAIKALSKKENVTMFMLLLASFKTILYRYTGQEKIVLGSPVSGRSRAEIEKLIGFFVNTLVLSTDLSGNPPFRELLSRVRHVSLDAFSHQDLPFEKLVEELQPDRDLSRNPLFQVMFQFFKSPAVTSSPSELQDPLMQIDKGTAILDLALHLGESPMGIFGLIEYSTDLFDSITITRMIEHFKILLEGIVSDPEKRISELPILSKSEKKKLLFIWNDTQTASPVERSIIELFETQVEKTPESVAVVFQDERLTYQELNCRANKLAHYLGRLGVIKGAVIGICMTRSVEMLYAVLGVLKAGGAYAPLDPAYPKERLDFMVKDANVHILLTQQALLERFPSLTEKVVSIDETWEVISGEKNLSNPGIEIDPENLAYIIYTSGSTGRPKGVAMNHHTLSNLISWQLQGADFSERASTLQFASLSFDVSFQEIFSTFCSGGKLVLVSEETRRDPFALWTIIKEKSVERMFLPFVALQQLAEVAESLEDADALSLKEVITAGEQLRITSQIRRLFSHLKHCSLQNQYGPSETHVVTSYTLSGLPIDWPALPPIGRPIANTQIFILDSHLQPVPAGVTGDLYIGGNCISRGYLNRPDLTSERFIPNPFSREKGGRLYKTGDLARYSNEGEIEFLGRADRQIKLRGFRVELGEIETVLAQHHMVQECAVWVYSKDTLVHGKKEEILGHDKRLVAYEVFGHDKRLVAYIVNNKQYQGASKNGPVTLNDSLASQLRKFLQKKLPEYMIPSDFILLDKLPLAPSGKLDRDALPPPGTLWKKTEKEYLAPTTIVEKRLAKMWSEVLGIEGIGIKENFFTDLGGHSLLATRLISLIRSAFQIELPLTFIFNSPTIEELGLIIEKRLIEEIENIPEDSQQF